MQPGKYAQRGDRERHHHRDHQRHRQHLNTASVGSGTPDPNTANNSNTLTIDSAAQAPTIDHLSPVQDSAGLGNFPLVIIGTSFYSGVTTVTLNGASMSYTVTNDQTCGSLSYPYSCQGLRVTVPAAMTAVPGTVAIVVTNPNQFPASATLTIYPFPGTAVAAFQITGLPAAVATGTDYTMTVTAVDINGNPVTGYQGVVNLTDAAYATTFMPASPYQFTANDHGSRTFTVSFQPSSFGLVITATDAAFRRSPAPSARRKSPAAESPEPQWQPRPRADRLSLRRASGPHRAGCERHQRGWLDGDIHRPIFRRKRHLP